MSTWTHVTGAVRFDGVALTAFHRQEQREHLLDIIGYTCKFDSPPEAWKKCTVPCGSEGSIQYHLHEYDTGLPWMAVLIWGDLRDYEDMQAIADWFLKVCHAWPLVRQGVIEIQCGMESRVVKFNYEDEPKEVA